VLLSNAPDIAVQKNAPDASAWGMCHCSPDEKKGVQMNNQEITENSENLEKKVLLSVSETARYLGLCEKTIRTHTKRGLLPHLRIGRFIKFRRIALDGLLTKLEKGGLQ